VIEKKHSSRAQETDLLTDSLTHKAE